MQAPVACEIQAWRSFGQLSGAQPSAWIWAWSWDPLKLMRRHPPHHLSPAWAKHPAGLDPEAGLGRSKSPQQRSVQAGKPVNSEQVSCSFSSIALTRKPGNPRGLLAPIFGDSQGEIADSLCRIFEKLPFLGDCARRPGSIGTAWPVKRLYPRFESLSLRQQVSYINAKSPSGEICSTFPAVAGCTR